ncbi:MAG: HD domain-containing protein [Clostridia bacterium]|nr:HD domain-containing protein [Clostridia bacterium]
MNLLDPKAAFVIERLNHAGYEAYLVGGAVRDLIMNKEPKDTDITTSALPHETKKVFEDYPIIETGLKHGTVTLLLNHTPIEITTFRIETGYSDGRHPDKVDFTKDITKDLSRRDFTMNSIAYNPVTGFVDPFNGKDDIKNGIIRCVGTPKERFTEDSLRVLRAIRFASSSGFSIDGETERAMTECKHLLSNISMERVYSEIVKLLCGRNVKQVLLKYSGIISVVIPEISRMAGFDQHNFHHKYDLLEHTATVTESIEPVPHLRLAAFLHDVAKPRCMSFDDDGVGHFYGHPALGAKIADEILQKLKCDNETREKVVKLIKLHDNPIEENERIIKRKLRSIGKDLLYDLIALQKADTMGLADEFQCRHEHFRILTEMTERILEEEQCFSLKALAVNGHDMIECGFKGKEIGEKLNWLLEAVIDGKIENEKDALIEQLKKDR